MESKLRSEMGLQIMSPQRILIPPRLTSDDFKCHHIVHHLDWKDYLIIGILRLIQIICAAIGVALIIT